MLTVVRPKQSPATLFIMICMSLQYTEECRTGMYPPQGPTYVFQSFICCVTTKLAKAVTSPDDLRLLRDCILFCNSVQPRIVLPQQSSDSDNMAMTVVNCCLTVLMLILQ